MSQPQPKLEVSIAVDPPAIVFGENSTLILTAILSHPAPITIYTWPTIFNLSAAQRWRSFFCIDLSDESKPVQVDIDTACGRGGISLQRGSRDDPFFVTFHPGVPVRFTEKFDVPARPYRPLTPGHRYRFGIDGRHGSLGWRWLKGTRDDVLTAGPEFMGLRSPRQIIVWPARMWSFRRKHDAACTLPSHSNDELQLDKRCDKWC